MIIEAEGKERADKYFEYRRSVKSLRQKSGIERVYTLDDYDCVFIELQPFARPFALARLEIKRGKLDLVSRKERGELFSEQGGIDCVDVFFLTSCGSGASAESVAETLCRQEVGLPSGIIYTFNASEGATNFLSDDMLLGIYGFDRSLKGLTDGAVRFSSGFHPCELAVFVCEDFRSAEDIALHLKNRVALLQSNAARSAELCHMSEEDYREYTDRAAVIISGNYVALIISSDTPTAKRVFLRAT